MAARYERCALDHFATRQSIGQNAALEFSLYELAFSTSETVSQWTWGQCFQNLQPLRPCDFDPGSEETVGNLGSLLNQN